MQSSRLAGFILTLAMLEPAIFLHGAARAADMDHGRRIAEHWCASCHLVSPEQARANADVPSFAAIARKYSDSAALAAFLANPHPPMPDLSLSKPEIADLVAYIRAQK
jgi:mono/diheme cytochrome c family protein